MATNSYKQKHGFTIIELVLVLAIAGLIFLTVFVALPALQRSQRDTQRRNDMVRFVSALENKRINNGGKLMLGTHESQANRIPMPSENDIIAFVDSDDPSGESYKLRIVPCIGVTINNPKILTGEECTTSALDIDQEQHINTFTDSYGRDRTYPSYPLAEFTTYVLIITGAKCGYETTSKYVAYSAAGRNNFAILYKLEGSGIFCADNS